MRVILVSCVFPPEPVTSAFTSADLAAGLVKAGHEVTVITSFPSRPHCTRYAGWRRTLRRMEESRNGYRLIRTGSFFSRKGTLAQKLIENISFGLTSALQMQWTQADVIYANTWPIFASGLLGLACCVPRQRPLVLSVQDVHPEAVSALGKLRPDGLVPKILKWLDRRVARRASAIVTISQGFADFYHQVRSVPAERIHVVNNWMDETRIRPFPRIGDVRRRLGIAECAFVVLYAGNIGQVAGVETIVETAKLFREDPQIAFVIAGDGSHRAACERAAQAAGLSNIHFLCPLPDEIFCEVQGMADLLVLPTRAQAAITSVPSKLIAYMLSGRPVLAAVEPQSDTAEVIRRADCGLQVPPEDSHALARGIRELAARPQFLKECGQRARRYAEQHFSRSACVPCLIRILEAVADSRSRSSSSEEVAPWKRAA